MKFIRTFNSLLAGGEGIMLGGLLIISAWANLPWVARELSFPPLVSFALTFIFPFAGLFWLWRNVLAEFQDGRICQRLGRQFSPDRESLTLTQRSLAYSGLALLAGLFMMMAILMPGYLFN